jgi:hypothetical protein
MDVLGGLDTEVNHARIPDAIRFQSIIWLRKCEMGPLI